MTHGTATDTCVHGHPWTPENTYTTPSGKRHCRECNRATSLAWKQANREHNRERDRRRLRDIRDACPDCGQPKYPASERCQRCVSAAAAERQAFVESLWAQGKTLREINRVLGLPDDSAYVCVMRTRGWNLPYRRADRLPSGTADKTPGNQIGPASEPPDRDRGNQERGS